MTDYDDLSTYDGDVEHDGWVDFSYHENTGELDDYFDDEDDDYDDEDYDDEEDY